MLFSSAMGSPKVTPPYRQQRDDAGLSSLSRTIQHDSLHAQIFGQRNVFNRELTIGFGGILRSAKILQRILAALITRVDKPINLLATTCKPLQEVFSPSSTPDTHIPEAASGLVVKFRRALVDGCRSSVATAAGNTPLAFAARNEGCNFSLGKMLLFCKPMITTIQNSAGDTALILAVAEKNVKLVQAMIVRFFSKSLVIRSFIS